MGGATLKKVNRDTEGSKKTVRSSNTFERPALRRVIRDSDKKLEDDSKKDKEGQEEQNKEEEKEEEEAAPIPAPMTTKEEEETNHGMEEFEWDERFDESYKRPYYFNEKTQEASWDQPEKFKPMEKKRETIEEGRDEEVFEWVEKLDETHKIPFYFNEKTGEAVWEAPEKFKPMGKSGGDELPEAEDDKEEPSAEQDKYEWEQLMDPTHNVHYYRHMLTGEAKWEAPEKFKPLDA